MRLVLLFCVFFLIGCEYKTYTNGIGIVEGVQKTESVCIYSVRFIGLDKPSRLFHSKKKGSSVLVYLALPCGKFSPNDTVTINAYNERKNE